MTKRQAKKFQDRVDYRAQNHILLGAELEKVVNEIERLLSKREVLPWRQA